MDFTHVDTLVKALDLLATFAFALVGARVAADRGLDLGGIAFIAAVASTAGGTLRNLCLGQRPIWITDGWIVGSIVLAFVITVAFRTTKPIGKFLLSLDTFGLAVAAISGSKFALGHGASWFAAIILGVITATAGGLLRDLLCQVEPVVLHRETLATSSLVGSALYVALENGSMNSNIIAVIGGASVVIARSASIYLDLHLPKIKKS
ncbi:MAG: hypothetical protein RL414_911 [Actinomycetota bacterium]|jgi:uncharacterized membrane protein YeiH